MSVVDRLIAECEPGAWDGPPWIAPGRRDPSSSGLGKTRLTPVASAEADGWVHSATESMRALWMYGDTDLAAALRARGLCVIFALPTTRSCWWRVIPLADLAAALAVMAIGSILGAAAPSIMEHERRGRLRDARRLIDGNIGYALGVSALPRGPAVAVYQAWVAS